MKYIKYYITPFLTFSVILGIVLGGHWMFLGLAVIFFVMDVSGSMTKSKKFLARSFFFLLYQFLNHRYSSVDVVFISHTAEAKEVNEQQFFTQAPSGGTLVSTGLKKAEEIIEKRYHPNNWNIYTFYCGDGAS